MHGEPCVPLPDEKTNRLTSRNINTLHRVENHRNAIMKRGAVGAKPAGEAGTASAAVSWIGHVVANNTDIGVRYNSPCIRQCETISVKWFRANELGFGLSACVQLSLIGARDDSRL